MNTLSKIKDFRARRAEAAAHRVMIKRQLDNDAARKAVMLYRSGLM